MTPWKNNWSFVSSKFPPLRRPETVPTQINARHMDNTSQYCARTSRMPKEPLRSSNLVFSSRAFFSVSSKDAGICWVFSSSSARDGSAALAAL